MLAATCTVDMFNIPCKFWWGPGNTRHAGVRLLAAVLTEAHECVPAKVMLTLVSMGGAWCSRMGSWPRPQDPVSLDTLTAGVIAW